MANRLEKLINKVHCMDCLEGMKQLPDGCVDLVVTDPPYFLPVQSYVGTREKSYKHRTLADTSVLKGYFERVFESLHRLIKPTGTYYVFCDAQSYPIFYTVMFPYCKHVRLIVWDKIISYNGYTWRHQHELIAWGELEKSLRIPTGDGDIIKCRGVLQDDRVHPAQKPENVVKKLIAKHGEENDLILDPFMGSGTTAVACKQLGRRFIGFEINKGDVKICNQRLAQEVLL